eukprot:3184788-Prymnesium_polylepis.1
MRRKLSGSKRACSEAHCGEAHCDELDAEESQQHNDGPTLIKLPDAVQQWCEPRVEVQGREAVPVGVAARVGRHKAKLQHRVGLLARRLAAGPKAAVVREVPPPCGQAGHVGGAHREFR